MLEKGGQAITAAIVRLQYIGCHSDAEAVGMALAALDKGGTVLEFNLQLGVTRDFKKCQKLIIFDLSLLTIFLGNQTIRTQIYLSYI